MSADELNCQVAQLLVQAGPIRPGALPRLMGLVPEGQSDEEFAAEAKRRFAHDWQLHLAQRHAMPRLRWALRRVWPIR